MESVEEAIWGCFSRDASLGMGELMQGCAARDTPTTQLPLLDWWTIDNEDINAALEL